MKIFELDNRSSSVLKNINQSSYFMIERGVGKVHQRIFTVDSAEAARRGQRLGFISNDATYPQLAPLL